MLSWSGVTTTWISRSLTESGHNRQADHSRLNAAHTRGPHQQLHARVASVWARDQEHHAKTRNDCSPRHCCRIRSARLSTRPAILEPTSAKRSGSAHAARRTGTDATSTQTSTTTHTLESNQPARPATGLSTMGAKHLGQNSRETQTQQTWERDATRQNVLTSGGESCQYETKIGTLSNSPSSAIQPNQTSRHSVRHEKYRTRQHEPEPGKKNGLKFETRTGTQ
jgi:hypothetical protein